MAFDSITAAGWQGPIVVALGVQGAVVALLAWSTIAGRDLWPFSHYPMFAAYENTAGVRIFRLRLRFADGRAAWLADHAADLVEEFSEYFEKLRPVARPPDVATIAWLGQFWRRACRRDPRLAGVVRLEVMAHAALLAKSGAITIAEKEMLSIDAGSLPTA